jgi:hypothetical protein
MENRWIANDADRIYMPTDTNFASLSYKTALSVYGSLTNPD